VYKKHYPPALKDDVWRLEKIGKDGSFHKRLSAAGIYTVEDFLRLGVRDSQRLRTVRHLDDIWPSFMIISLCLVADMLSDIVDSWKWHVQSDVGCSHGACKDLYFKREAIRLLW